MRSHSKRDIRFCAYFWMRMFILTWLLNSLFYPLLFTGNRAYIKRNGAHPLSQTDVQGRRMDILAVKDTRKLQLHCDAVNAGRLEVGTDTLSVVIGQPVRVGKQEEMWDSVHIVYKEERNGAL